MYVDKMRYWLLSVVLVFMLGASVGYWVGTGQPPTIIRMPVERTIGGKTGLDIPPVVDRSSEGKLERIVEYRDTVLVDTVFVAMPREVRDDYRISSSAPIGISVPVVGDPRVRWTSYNPRQGTWETFQYAVKPSPWTYGAEIETGAALVTPVIEPYAQVRLYAGYKKVEPFIGVRIDPQQTAPVFGVRWRFGR